MHKCLTPFWQKISSLWASKLVLVALLVIYYCLGVQRSLLKNRYYSVLRFRAELLLCFEKLNGCTLGYSISLCMLKQIFSQVVFLLAQKLPGCFCSNWMLIDAKSENLDCVLLRLFKCYHVGQAYNYED